MKRRSYAIDLKGVRALRDLHRRLAEALPVPEGYGGNFDALHDFLTEYGTSMKITFSHVSAGFRTFRRVCADAMAETPGLEIAFV